MTPLYELHCAVVAAANACFISVRHFLGDYGIAVHPKFYVYFFCKL